MSDSDSTIKQTPRPFQWTGDGVSFLTLNITNTVTALNASYPEYFVTHNDSQALRWSADMSSWDYKISGLRKKVEIATNCYKELHRSSRLTELDGVLLSELMEAWRSLIVLFKHRANLYNSVCERAANRPTEEDVKVLQELDDDIPFPKPQDFPFTIYEEILSAMESVTA